MRKQAKRQMLEVLTAGMLFSIIGSGSAIVNASDEKYLRAEDYIVQDNNGNSYCVENDHIKTGKFSLQPNYSMGDLDADGTVNATDAANILLASAAAGAGNVSPELQIVGNVDAITDEKQALKFADVNQDNVIDSADASYVLEYAAEAGSSDEATPLGFAYYYANQDGTLQTGLIHDEQTGNVYYADENYELVTGWLDYENHRYYFNTDAEAVTGTQTIDGKTYYFDSNHQLSDETKASSHLTGWVTDSVNIYFLDENGQKSKGWLVNSGSTYYLDETTGALQSGWLELAPPSASAVTVEEPDFSNQDNWTDADWDKYYSWLYASLSGGKSYYYFSPEYYAMMTGWLTLSEGTYYLDEDGKRHTGFLEYEGKTYKFDENGLMVTNLKADGGSYDENGVFTKNPTQPKYDIDSNVREMLENAQLNPGIRNISVYDRQYPSRGTSVEFTIKLSDRDYEIIEQFAAEHFTDDMSIADRLYATWMWIHENVDYAYAGSKWNSIVNLSYPDAIFNHKMGQCVQYNGAMAAVLAYYGFDVYMVKGWTNPPKNSSQHYWTEVNIDGKRYYVETGNLGKNGSYWKYFFADAETIDYTKTGAFG